MIRGLTAQDFRDAGLEFHADGRVTPAPRSFVRPTAMPATETGD